MRDMYRRYIARLQVAKDLLPRVSADDAYLDIVSFDTQQSLEFLLKHILSINGVVYPETHDIGELITLSRRSGIDYDAYAELMELSNTITMWEEEIEYVSGVKSDVNLIRKVHSLIETLNSEFTSKTLPRVNDNVSVL